MGPMPLNCQILSPQNELGPAFAPKICGILMEIGVRCNLNHTSHSRNGRHQYCRLFKVPSCSDMCFALVLQPQFGLCVCLGRLFKSENQLLHRTRRSNALTMSIIPLSFSRPVSRSAGAILKTGSSGLSPNALIL